MSREEHEVGPRDLRAILLLERPQQALRLVEVLVVGPRVERCEAQVAFAAAAKASAAALSAFAEMAQWRDEMENQLRAAFPAVAVFGAEAPRLANTSCFSLPGLSSEMLVMALDLAGISVSAGSACSSGKVSRSHVLDAMGVSDDLSTGVIRASFGWASRAEDGATLVETWCRLAQRQSEQVSQPHEVAE